ncbi:outer membrane beta-barrel protein [Candidatus Pelagibacter sp.]|nr:outer membrane beta-barrel protein [Candidatus Pelagibacter sp.]
MKKINSILIGLFLILSPVASQAAGSFAIGVSVSDNTLDTAGKEDVDNNGTIDATKNVTDDFAVGSIFAEFTNMGEKFGVTLGLDYIPFDADIDKRSISQTSMTTSSTVTSGTNSVSGSVEDHFTIYIQPGFMIKPNTMLYGTLGYANATVNGKSTSLTHTNINKDQDLEGTKIGVGVKHVYDNGIFVKADYAETDYDVVSFTTSNNTKATADLDNKSYGLSIGKQF